jgi:hypothetical protein
MSITSSPTFCLRHLISACLSASSSSGLERNPFCALVKNRSFHSSISATVRPCCFRYARLASQDRQYQRSPACTLRLLARRWGVRQAFAPAAAPLVWPGPRVGPFPLRAAPGSVRHAQTNL